MVAIPHDRGVIAPTDIAHRPTEDLLSSRFGLAVTSGLVVGVLTSFGQGHLNGALNALVNSASAWLVVPFFVAARMRTLRGAALAGFTVCSLQLVGYTVASELRGFTSGGAIVLFWTGCAVVGGPLFGAAGRLWRSGVGDLRGIGSSVLASAFLAEGLWLYLHELRHYATAALWITISAILAATMPRGQRERRWLPLTLLTGLLGEIVLSQVYVRSF